MQDWCRNVRGRGVLTAVLCMGVFQEMVVAAGEGGGAGASRRQSQICGKIKGFN